MHHVGAEAQLVLQIINRHPPKSFVMADSVILLIEPNRPRTVFFVLFSEEGCALGQGMVPIEIISQFLETI